MKERIFQKQLEKIEQKYIEINLNNLENESMIDLMYHQYQRFISTRNYINLSAQWKRWIRV